MKVLVCDPVSPKGIALLQQRPEFQVTVLPKKLPEPELLPLVSDAIALVVRSETKVTRKVFESAPKLRVVGRAGVGKVGWTDRRIDKKGRDVGFRVGVLGTIVAVRSRPQQRST